MRGNPMNTPKVELSGYVPGALGRVTELHAAWYHEHWGFDLYFESMVATELAEFLGRLDEKRDGFWVAHLERRIVGSVSIDGSLADTEGARLRWFILEPGHQGRGIGRLLMETALEFCREAGFRKVFLWTFAGLDAARHLYERHGFKLSVEHPDDQWGKTVTEQMFTLEL